MERGSVLKITKGKIYKAKKVVVYGTEGIGKSTFASEFPDPLFIDTEGSTRELDVARFDPPTSWTMLKSQVEYVARYPDVCKTLVIDTADWAEKIEIDYLCKSKGWDGLEGARYGKGYTYSAEEFGVLLNLLSDVVDKGINVVITAHAEMKKIELPEEMGSYDHWSMKTSKKVSPMIREWADMVLFANYKIMVVNVDGQGMSFRLPSAPSAIFLNRRRIRARRKKRHLPHQCQSPRKTHLYPKTTSRSLSRKRKRLSSLYRQMET